MRYFLFAMAGCMLLACNDGKSYDLHNIVYKNVTKNLSSDVKVDSLRLLTIDTTTKKVIIDRMMEQTKEELTRSQELLEDESKILETAKVMGQVIEPDGNGEWTDSMITPAEIKVNQDKEQVALLEKCADSLDRLGKEMNDGERTAYWIVAQVYYSLNGIQKDASVSLGFWEGQNTNELPNALLPEVAYEKWNRKHNALPE